MLFRGQLPQPIDSPLRSAVQPIGLPWEGPAGSRAFTPLDLGSKLTLWLDQRDLVESAGAYSDWGDQSPANNDFTQGTAANRPASGQTVNGYAAPDFVTNDSMTCASLYSAIWTATAGYLWIVADTTGEVLAVDSGSPFLQAALFGADGGSNGVTWTLSGVQAFVYDGATKKTGYAAAAVGKHLAEVSLVSGTLSTQVDDGAAQTLAGVGTLTVNQALMVGRNYTSVAFFNGRIASIIATNAAVSAGERTQVRAYLAAKYGVTV